MGGTESLTSPASRPIFPVQSGKRSHTINLWKSRYCLKIRSKTSSKPIIILWIQTLMMTLELWSSYNHKQSPLIMTPFKDKPENLRITYTSPLGMNGTWPGSFIRISFSLYILTESVNYMAISEYSQNSLKISTSMRLCAMTVIEELNLQKKRQSTLLDREPSVEGRHFTAAAARIQYIPRQAHSYNHSSSNYRSASSRTTYHEGIPICKEFNRKEGCKRDICRFQHVCLTCRLKSHGESSCYKLQNKPTQPQLSSKSNTDTTKH